MAISNLIFAYTQTHHKPLESKYEIFVLDAKKDDLVSLTKRQSSLKKKMKKNGPTLQDLADLEVTKFEHL